jgi:hypothetical protein
MTCLLSLWAPLLSLVEILMDELRSFTGDGWKQEDDITLMTLERSR